MPQIEPSLIRNADAQWDHFDPRKYNTQYAGKIIFEDLCLARAVIGALDAYGVPLGSLQNGVDICNGGVPRGPALIAPYIADDGKLDWIDYGKPQVEQARDTIERGRRGDLGEWAIHQTDMGKFRAEWSGAVYRACQLGEAVKGSIFKLPKDTYDIGITCFGPESLTEDKDECVQAATSFFESIKSGGLAVMLSMYGSTGYNSAGVNLPALAEWEQSDVLQVASDAGLEHLQAFLVQATHDARPTDDPFTYTSMGAVVGIKLG